MWQAGIPSHRPSWLVSGGDQKDPKGGGTDGVLADKNGVDMRTLDKALWQFSVTG